MPRGFLQTLISQINTDFGSPRLALSEVEWEGAKEHEVVRNIDYLYYLASW